MTVQEMVQQLVDRIGLTGTPAGTTINRLTRAVNLGKDRLVAAHKWPWLETSTSQLFTSGTRTYNLVTEAQSVVSLEQSAGFPVRKVERDTFDEIHRLSTATAAAPSVYTEQGRSSGGRIEVQVWPTPASNTTGRLRYLVTVSDIDSTGSTGSYTRIPVTHHKAIVEAALCEYYKQQGMESRAGMANQQFMAELELLGVRTVSPVIRDGSEQ